MSANHHRIIQLVEQGQIPTEKLEQALTVSGVYPDSRAWRKFIEHLFLWLGGLAQAVHQDLPRAKPDRAWSWRQTVAASDSHVMLDEHNVARFLALYDGQSLPQDEILLRYRVSHGRVKFDSNAFYFQEGHADIFQPAR